MPKPRNYADVETWTVSQLIDATSEYPNGAKKVTIPEFQRRLVWSQEKQEKLITSIKSGYPFGSLLLYEDILSGKQSNGAKRLYKLIDGLQRTQALLKYTNKPNDFFRKDQIPDDFVQILIREFGLSAEEDQEKVSHEVEKWIKNLKGFSETDGWGVGELTRTLVEKLFNYDPQSNEYYSEIGRASNNGLLQKAMQNFLKDVREDADISEAKIPIIIYTGPPEELPLVFELLNSQGTVLSRYEIFAAQWMDKREKIENQKIITAIWDKYEALEEAGFTLDVVEQAPTNKERRDREYSLFEYLFGFGHYLSSEFKHLFRDVQPDRPSSAGFNLVSACVGLPVAQMTNLPDYVKKYPQSDLEHKLLETVKYVDKMLEPILSVTQKNRAVSIYHSELQIISIIALAFQIRYDLRNLVEIQGWRSQWDKLEKNARLYYLYDILRDYWRGSGDTKLHDTVQKRRYLNPVPSASSWRQIFETWFSDNQIIQTHKKRYVRDQSNEILILKYIYAHKFTLMNNAKYYHVEHIIPVEQVMSIMPEDGCPINAINNLALLEGTENMRKGDLIFTDYLDKLRNVGQLNDAEYQSQLRFYEDQLICNKELIPEQLTLASFEEFLRERFKILVDEFLHVWQESIPAEKDS